MGVVDDDVQAVGRDRRRVRRPVRDALGRRLDVACAGMDWSRAKRTELVLRVRGHGCASGSEEPQVNYQGDQWLRRLLHFFR